MSLYAMSFCVDTSEFSKKIMIDTKNSLCHKHSKSINIAFNIKKQSLQKNIIFHVNFRLRYPNFPSEREIGFGQLREHDVAIINKSFFRHFPKPVARSIVNARIPWREINMEYIFAQKYERPFSISLNLCYHTKYSVQYLSYCFKEHWF